MSEDKTPPKVHHWFLPSEGNRYHPHIVGKRGLRFMLMLMLGVEGFLVASVIAQQSGIDFLAAVEPGSVVALTNGERVQDNLGLLSDNPLLDAAAQAKANDMATRKYFSHVGPDGKEPWDWISESGYDYQYAGENLAVRFTDSTDVVHAWMASPEHRANILKPQYRDTGVGVAEGIYQGQPASFIVQYFGSVESGRKAAISPASSTPVVSATSSIPAAASSSASSSVALNPNLSGAVAGANTSAHTASESGGNTLWRTLLRIASSPSEESYWFFSVMALILITGAGLTFVGHMHARLRPKGLLLAVVALALFATGVSAFNTHFFSAIITATNETASVALSNNPTVVGMMTDMATSTERQ